jgi:hypothetical protein
LGDLDSLTGHHAPAEDQPFLSTRELFILKLMLTAAEQDAHIAAGTDERRAAPGDERTAPADQIGRCLTITRDGSTATTWWSIGSSEPAPAQTFTTLSASPSASRIAARRPTRILPPSVRA